MEQPGRRLGWPRAARWPGVRQLLVAALLGALGFAAVTQIREQADEGSYGALREQDLLDLLVALDRASERGASELSGLEAQNDDLSSSITDAERRADSLLEQIQGLEIIAGSVQVRGPGVRITVTADSAAPLVLPFITALSELRLNDAESIEVNDAIRVTEHTAIEQAGSGLTFAGRRVETPYVIEAIGPAALLADAMDFAGGLRSDVEAVGGQVRIQQRETITIDSLAEPPDIQIAVPQR